MVAESPAAGLVAKSGAEVRISAVAPQNVMAYAGHLELVYCSAFGQAPWFESAREARRFVIRLLDHTASHGFRLVIASVGRHLVGLGYGRVALSRNEQVEERYVPLIEWVGPDVADAVLYEAFELTELAIVPSWEGQGIGALLHDHLMAAAPCERAWLLTHRGADRAQALYRSRGWAAVADIGTAFDGTRRVLMATSPGTTMP